VPPRPSRAEARDRAMTALTAAALALTVLLLAGLITLLAVRGLGAFRVRPLDLLELRDGSRLLVEIRDRERIPAGLPGAGHHRIRARTGNRDLTGNDFLWIDESEIVHRSRPRDAALLERLEWGPFLGFAAELRRDGAVLARGPREAFEAARALLPAKRAQWERIRELERGEIGAVNRALERLRLERRALARRALPPEERERRESALAASIAEQQARYRELAGRLDALRAGFERERLLMRTADGREREIPLGHVVRMIRPNALGPVARAGVYLSRLREFLLDEPRESNTEGGIFPALFGTVLMVLIMALAVTPFGVFAAIYLREYSRGGPFVRAIRVAVHNLAGVPSIVFGVFGLGFFVYGVGGVIDRLFFPDALPTPTFGTGGILWASLTLALLTVPVVIVATEEGLDSVPEIARQGSRALGATRFETLVRVILPGASPGILTGLILAMSRAAGEVAPLMVVGMVKLAPALPLDTEYPYLHLERKFMHLGFHIYDVGFQSPNVEAVLPLVYATALLLIGVVLVSNLAAILLRNRLRRRFASPHL